MFGSAAVWLQCGVTPVCGWARSGMTAKRKAREKDGKEKADPSRMFRSAAVWLQRGVTWVCAWGRFGMTDCGVAEAVVKEKADPSRMFGWAVVWLQRGVTWVCGWARFGMTDCGVAGAVVSVRLIVIQNPVGCLCRTAVSELLWQRVGIDEGAFLPGRPR